jgi:hypothetical protein
MTVPTPHPLQVGGTQVLLAGRRPDGKVLVASANRFGRPLGGLSEVHAHQLRGIGWHIAAIKEAIAALPLIVFAYDQDAGDQDAAARGNAASAPAGKGTAAPTGGRLHAHFSLPTGDR